jgi:hypothetical protein
LSCYDPAKLGLLGIFHEVAPEFQQTNTVLDRKILDFYFTRLENPSFSSNFVVMFQLKKRFMHVCSEPLN